jgi:hypothetical protein
MSTVLRVGAKSQVQFADWRRAGPLAEDLGTEVDLIQALIPLGLEAAHFPTGQQEVWRRKLQRA